MVCIKLIRLAFTMITQLSKYIQIPTNETQLIHTYSGKLWTEIHYILLELTLHDYEFESSADDYIYTVCNKFIKSEKKMLDIVVESLQLNRETAQSTGYKPYPMGRSQKCFNYITYEYKGDLKISKLLESGPCSQADIVNAVKLRKINLYGDYSSLSTTYGKKVKTFKGDVGFELQYVLDSLYTIQIRNNEHGERYLVYSKGYLRFMGRSKRTEPYRMLSSFSTKRPILRKGEIEEIVKSVKDNTAEVKRMDGKELMAWNYSNGTLNK